MKNRAKKAHFAQFWCNVRSFRINTYEKHKGEGGGSQMVISCRPPQPRADVFALKAADFGAGAQELQWLGIFWSIASTNGRHREGRGWGRSARSCAIKDGIRTIFGIPPLKSCHQLA